MKRLAFSNEFKEGSYLATEKLIRAVVSGPVTAMDDAIRALMLDREFQPLQASSTLGATTPSSSSATA